MIYWGSRYAVERAIGPIDSTPIVSNVTAITAVDTSADGYWLDSVLDAEWLGLPRPNRKERRAAAARRRKK